MGGNTHSYDKRFCISAVKKKTGICGIFAGSVRKNDNMIPGKTDIPPSEDQGNLMKRS